MMPVKIILISLIFLTSGCASFNAAEDLSKQGYSQMTAPEIMQKVKGGVTVYVIDRMHTPGAPVAHYYAEDGSMNSSYLKKKGDGWKTGGKWSVTEDATLCHAWKKWGTHCYYVFVKPGAVTTYVHAKYGFVNHTEVRVALANPENF